MLNKRDFEKIQRKTGFNLDLLEKSYHLTRLLNQMQKNKILAESLTLKGGTALNFLHLDMSRLSIDIDFNFTGAIERDDMIKLRPPIEKSIITLGENLGYNVKNRGSPYMLSRYSLHYTTIRNTKDLIKIEINFLDRLPIGNIVTKKFPSLFLDITLFQVKTYSLEEIAAQKMKACLERSEPRDIYDLYCLSKQKMDINKTRKYFAVYFCMIKEGKKENLAETIEGYALEKIKQEIQQFIKTDKALDAAEIRKDAAEFLHQILSFSDQEQHFIKTFYDKRKINAGLLFKDKPTIEQHPVLLYKLNEMKKSS